MLHKIKTDSAKIFLLFCNKQTSTFHHLSTWKAKQMKLASENKSIPQEESTQEQSSPEEASEFDFGTFSPQTNTTEQKCFAYFDMVHSTIQLCSKKLMRLMK